MGGWKKTMRSSGMARTMKYLGESHVLTNPKYKKYLMIIPLASEHIIYLVAKEQ
jgi:hypothetical protein